MAGLQRTFSLFLAFAINYAAVLLLIIVWRNNFWGYLLSVVVGFILGLVAGRVRDFLALALLAYIGASFMSTLILILPVLLRPSVVWFLVEAGVLGALAIIAYNSFVVIPLSLLFGFFGLFVCDRLVKVSKTPKFEL